MIHSRVALAGVWGRFPLDETKVSVRASVVVRIMAGVLLSPLATAGLSPPSAGMAQIESASHVPTLAVTLAPEGPAIVPTV